MDWLLELILSTAIGNWLLLSEWGWLVGWLLIAAFVLFGGMWAVWKYGDVRLGADPEIPRVVEPLRRALPAAPIAPNYVRFVEAVDAMAAEIDDLVDTVEFKAVEVEVVEDPSLSPIFYQIKRPPPAPDLETFTQGWTRERLERIKEGRPT